VTIRAAGRLLAASLVLFVLAGVAAFGQTAPAAAAPAATPAPARPPEDALGRTTPRGTLFAFLAAARKEDGELSSQYLNTRLKGVEAQELARQLYVVLDARLPARLTLVSDAPEGSRGNPLAPNRGRDRHGRRQERPGADRR
jgi:MscS family membrane protein